MEANTNKLSNATHVGAQEHGAKKAPVTTKTPLTTKNGKPQSAQHGNPESLRVKGAGENKDPMKLNGRKSELPKKKCENSKKDGKT